MTRAIGRREFLLQAGAVGVVGATAAAQVPSAKAVRVGIVGVGNRGTSILKVLLNLPGVEIPAVCDVDADHAGRAQGLVEKAGKARPETYTRGPEDFRRLVARDDLDAVMTATPWQFHAPVAVAAMKAGKYAGVEVPLALTVAECWELVETSEKTGMPCMMLENVCYFRNVLAVLNMVQQGVLGEMEHSEVGYQHFIKELQFDANGELSWRAQHALVHDRNAYPTHPIGPAAWWLNINRGDRFAYLTSMSTKSRGPHIYAESKFGPDSKQAKLKFAQGDVNTTLIKTANDATVTLYYNTQSPRPYDLILRAQGTKGIYSGTLEKIYIDGHSPLKSGEPAWEDAAPFYDQYEHPLWRKYGPSAATAGHGGSDYITFLQFINAVRNKTQTPIDVYDSATWSVIVPLSEQSVSSRSTPVDFPDFTRGKWKTARPLALEA